MKKLLGLLLLISFAFASKGSSAIDSLYKLIDAAAQPGQKAMLYIQLAEKQVNNNDAAALVSLTEAERLLPAENRKKIADIELLRGTYYNNNDNLSKSLEHHSQAYKVAKENAYHKAEADALIGLANAYGELQNLDTVDYYLTQAKTLIEKYQLYESEALYYYIMGMYHYEISKNKESLEYLILARNLAEKHRRMDVLPQIITAVGLVERHLGSHDESVKNLYEAEAVAKATGNQVALAWVYSALASSYAAIDMKKRAIEYYEASLDLAKKINLKECTGVVLAGIPQFVFGDSTLSKRKQALDIFKSLNDSFSYSLAALNLADLFLRKNMYDSAMKYLANIETRSKVMNNPMFASVVYLTIGSLHFRQNNLPLAEQYLLKGYEKYNETNRTNVQGLDLAGRLAELYQKKGDMAKALAYTQRYIAIRDTLDAQNTRQSVERREFRETLDNREAMLQLAEKDKALLEAKVNATRLEMIIVYVVAAAMLILVVIIFFFLRQKSRYAVVLEEKNEKINTLITELNHRVKNNFQVLSGIFSMQKASDDISDPIKLVQEGKGRVDAFLLLHQKLSFDSSMLEADIVDYMDDLLNNLAFQFGHSRSAIKKDFMLGNKKVDSEILMPLGLIVNELVTNAFKYSAPATGNIEVSVSLKELDDKVIELKIKDNGREQVNFGDTGTFGLRLVKSFSAYMHAQMEHRFEDGLLWTLKFTRYAA